MRWRVELSDYSFDIVYRPGHENIPADTFSRAHCSALSYNSLENLYDNLCHPGITQFTHFARSKNLPNSTEEIKKVTSCKVCAELKPNSYKCKGNRLIKATHPFERMSIDFKGPLPTKSKNKYILTIVDEYSQFPFAFPCPNIELETVIKCINLLFTIYSVCLITSILTEGCFSYQKN